MLYFIYWVVFSQSKGKWFFWEAPHSGVAETSSHFGGSSSDWLSQKDVWALWGFLREGILWSGLGPLQEQKENHFYNKQIMSWLFFLGGIDCVELQNTRDCSEPAPAHSLFSGWPLISQHWKLLNKPLLVWQMHGWFVHNAQRCFTDNNSKGLSSPHLFHSANRELKTNSENSTVIIITVKLLLWFFKW